MRKLFRFLFYPYRKKKLLAQSLFLIWIIRIGLWLFSFKKLNAWLSLSGSNVSAGGGQTDWDTVERVVRSVKACSRYVPYASCLTQALATRRLLEIRGQHPELKIGVKKDEDEKFAAHAWIEIDGRIIIGKHPFHNQYLVLESLGSAVL